MARGVRSRTASLVARGADALSQLRALSDAQAERRAQLQDVEARTAALSAALREHQRETHEQRRQLQRDDEPFRAPLIAERTALRVRLGEFRDQINAGETIDVAARTATERRIEAITAELDARAAAIAAPLLAATRAEREELYAREHAYAREAAALRLTRDQRQDLIERAGALMEEALAAAGFDTEPAAAHARVAHINRELDALGGAHQQMLTALRTHAATDTPDAHAARLEQIEALRERIQVLGAHEQALTEEIRAHRRETYRAVLGQVRPMGLVEAESLVFAPRSIRADADRVRAATAFFPREWVEQALAGSERIRIAKRARGRFESAVCGPDVIGISGHGERRTAVAVHELAHLVEHRVSEVVHAESAYYDQRTTAADGYSQDTQPLGRGYRSDEVYCPGDPPFPVAYLGKWYGGSHFELLSMGMEEIYAAPAGPRVLGDAHYRRWLLGTLAVG